MSRFGVDASAVVTPMKWPGFQPTCHWPTCTMDARWHLTFPHFEEYRCDEHKTATLAAAGSDGAA